MQPGQMFKERRHYLRINTSLNAEVINRNGETFDASITDLSMSGLTLEGEAAILQHIEAINPETGEPFFPLEASILFHLQLDNTRYYFKVTCRLIHKHRVSQKTLILGMRILAIDEGERNQFTRFIELSGNT